MARGEWAETTQLIEDSVAVLKEQNPMTIRQLFYQPVSRETLTNNINEYRKLSRVMTKAREDGRVDYDLIVDRSRPIYTPLVFDDPAEYARNMKSWYRRDYWQDQPNYCEIWTEKDAVVGSIEDLWRELGVTIRIGRGFLSTTRKHEIEEIFDDIGLRKQKEITVFYLGDHDPSGIDIQRDTEASINSFFDIKRLAIHPEDINDFNLPPLRIKSDDPRAEAFRREHGGECVELDALPPKELRRRIKKAVTGLLDKESWDRAVAVEKVEIASIQDFVKRWSAQ
jgi:hypothetical protein